jgi:hypothetical protein
VAFETDNAITYHIDNEVYQLIKNFGSKEEVVDEFSFENSKVILEYPFKVPTVMSTYPVKDLIERFIPSKNFDINKISHVRHMRKYAANKFILIPDDLIKQAIHKLIKGKVESDIIYDKNNVPKSQKMANTFYFEILENIPNFWNIYNEMYKESKDNHILYHLLFTDEFLEAPYITPSTEKVEDKLLKYLMYKYEKSNVYKKYEQYVGKNYPEILI